MSQEIYSSRRIQLGLHRVNLHLPAQCREVWEVPPRYGLADIARHVTPRHGHHAFQARLAFGFVEFYGIH